MTNVSPDDFGPLCDATLRSVTWERDGLGVTIELTLGGGESRRYLFTYVDHLDIGIQQRDNGSSLPLTWDGTASTLPNGRTRVVLDFAHQGAISLQCEEIVLIDV